MSSLKIAFLTISLVTPLAQASSWLETLESKQWLFGVAVEPRYLADEQYKEQLLSTFNAVTPENAGKWEAIHPKKDRYSFAGLDSIVSFAKEHQLPVRGHTLVWHNQNPNWLVNGQWTEDEAKSILFEHIDTVVGRYRGDIQRWDVVNEALADNGDMRPTYWYHLFGEQYLNMAFERAHQADPAAKLYYNDYAISDCGGKADGAYQLMKRLVAEGAPVHGIGFQGHYEVNNPVDLHCLNSNINRMGKLGLEVQITELDIRLNMAELDSALATKQSNQFRAMMGLLATNPYLNGITVWGLSDAHSWVPSWFQGQGSALLFDEQLQPKPALSVVKQSLLAFVSGAETFTLPERREMTLRSFPVFGSAELSQPLTLDTIAQAEVWQQTEPYALAFNQLTPTRLAVGKNQDVFAQWQTAYHGTQLYGHLTRQDDSTAPINSKQIWENDCVEVFIKWAGKLYQFRAQIGEDFADVQFPGSAKAIWSSDGANFYFIIEFPDITELKGQTIAWNIALADVDVPGGSREAQLYPVPGSNQSWLGKDMAELHFTGQNRPPSQDAKSVVAAIGANYSANGQVPASAKGLPQFPLSYGAPQQREYPTAMLTWRESGITAHVQVPAGYQLVKTHLNVGLPSEAISAEGLTAVDVTLPTALAAGQWYRVALSVVVQDKTGAQHTFSVAPQNGFFDIATQ